MNVGLSVLLVVCAVILLMAGIFVLLAVYLLKKMQGESSLLKGCLIVFLAFFALVLVSILWVALAHEPGRYTHSMRVPTHPGAWWTDRQAGLIGGIGGAFLGLMGGLVGTLAGMGKGRAFVIWSIRGMLVLAGVSLVAGLVAAFSHQPYSVYYPLLLIGIILLPVVGLNYRHIEAAYREAELRRMRIQDAHDAGRGEA